MIVSLILLGACGPRPAPPVASEEVPFDLGSYHRDTTASEEAAPYIDQGLLWLFAFNHEEAQRAFEEALRIDPTATMAAWGIAAAQGPHINFPMVLPEQARAAEDALIVARRLAPDGSRVERALVEAMDARHAWPPPEDRRALDEAYADAMRDVWHAHPKDADVGAFFAEALLDLYPWDLWLPDGSPRPVTEEAIATLEAVLALDPDHPLGNHLYIHAVEASDEPERANQAAETLRDLVPDAGHLQHMPTHIDVRLGRWQTAIDANAAALQADARYRRVRPTRGLWELYMAHDAHMLAHAAMMSGQSELAVDTIRQMLEELPDAWAAQNAAFADGYLVMPLEVLVRFGRWDEVLAEPEPAEAFPLARALRHQARGVACAAKGETEQARAEQQAFLAARDAVPEDARFGNNMAEDLLAVAEDVLEGEILFAEGRHDEAIAALRAAVEHEDALRYSEPPDWILPVRHALGAALLRLQRPQEAEVVYLTDLEKLPRNVWSLVGLANALRQQGRIEEAEAVEARLAKAAERADIVLSSSCACLPGT